MARILRTPVVAIAAAVVALAVVAVVLLGGGRSETLNARFPDAGQLVKGGLVEVAGRDVGKISSITLTDDGQADVKMRITDGAVLPLHDGTRAAIRAVGLSSVTNRFVELTPGPANARELGDGATLDASHTKGIVDLDELLDTFDAKTRGDLQEIIAEAARGLAKPTDRQLNASLRYLDPAFAQTNALGAQLTDDQAALEQLVRTGATTSHTLAQRPEALRGAVANTAAALTQIAGSRAALGDALERAPTVIARVRTTLRNLSAALPDVDPALRALRPAAPQFAALLHDAAPFARDAAPTFDAVGKLLPVATKALAPLPDLASTGVPALESATSAFKTLLPVIKGLRPYTPDLVAGLFEGLGGTTSGYYDANGHYARIAPTFGSNGLPGIIPAPPSGALGGLRTGQTARCPGNATDTAPDGSNPFETGDAAGTCDPKQTP